MQNINLWVSINNDIMSSEEHRSRREPDGEENDSDSSHTLTNTKQLPQQSNHLKAAGKHSGKHVEEDINLSDDSLEDDRPETQTEIAATNVSRDSERDNAHPHSRTADCVARNSSLSNHKRTNENTSPVDVATPQQRKHSVSDKTRPVHGSATTSQTSSRASSCTSKIPVLKRSTVKPSLLVEASKASLSSATMVTTTGDYLSHTVEGSDTPVSIPINELAMADSINQDEIKVLVSHNRQEKAAVTIQAYYRGWSARKANRNLEEKLTAPPQEGRAQDGCRRQLRNTKSFNSYVHEQMAITMAMMEANFEGVGLSHTQQERVEELRAGLDSFSLTNITATKQENKPHPQNMPRPQNMHKQRKHNEPPSNNWNRNQKRVHGSTGMEMTHGMGTKLLYKLQSYDTAYHGDTRHKSDWLGNNRHEGRGSYLQQSKTAQSIKSLRPPKLKPLPRRQSCNYLQNFIKSNKSSIRSNSNHLLSPDNMIPPLDESTPVSHTHWDSAVIGPSDHMTYDSYHYPVLPNIGDSYSAISLHQSVKPHNSYQQHWPGPPPPQPTYRTHYHHPQRGNYYTQRYSQHRH